jgi:hypothetical protein
MRHLGTMVAGLTAFFGATIACSGDGDPDNQGSAGAGAGGDAGSGGGGTSGDAGSGGAATGGTGGATGGSGGTGGALSARDACVAREGSTASAECAACRCDTCLDELDACLADTACATMAECTAATGCYGTDCYQPTTCQQVIDDNGGPFSASVNQLIATGNCLSGCTAECGGAAAGDPIPATITVTDGTNPIQGAEVCVLGTTDCGTSNASGETSLDVPALSEVGLTVIAADHLSVLYGLVSGPSTVEATVTLMSTASAEARATAAGVTLDDTKGHVSFTLFGPAGGTAALSPTSGTLIFTDANGDPDPSLTGSIEGASPTGVFWNVEPGDYDVVFSHAATTCQAGAVSTWAGSTEGTARVTVIAGALSAGGHWGSCDPLP